MSSSNNHSYVGGNALVLSDQFSAGRRHSPDIEQEGMDNILDKADMESGRKTTIGFVFPLNSGDSKDHAFETGNIFGFIIAYHKSVDNLNLYHGKRSTLLNVFVETSPTVFEPEEEPTLAPAQTEIPAPEEEEDIDRGCIIAALTFSSPLASEVQFLRDFREEIVYSTLAGSNFESV